MSYQIAIATGGRDYQLTDDDRKWLDRLLRRHMFRLVVHGGAKGADAGVAAWARSQGLCVAEVEAEWKRHGNSAGPIRNRAMAWAFQGLPVMCIAFPGNRGTKSMIQYARQRHIKLFDASRRDE